MDKLLFRTLLFDIYGELLTDSQKKAFEMHFLDDISLNEAAEELGTTKQAVWDIVNRTEKLLISYNEKLRLVEKHINTTKAIAEISALLDDIDDCEKTDLIRDKLLLISETD